MGVAADRPYAWDVPIDPSTTADVSAGLAGHGYLADEGLVTAVFLALTLRRPLFLEGEAGVGKTELAKTKIGRAHV